jgi:hypothetical protein
MLKKILHDAATMPNAAARCLSANALYFDVAIVPRNDQRPTRNRPLIDQVRPES